ncbi:MAG TPA: hypothetical protein VKB67_02135 [Rhizomicrobium sp.]|nr:hypothetical protein [Rhizomicrobium sp.]
MTDQRLHLLNRLFSRRHEKNSNGFEVQGPLLERSTAPDAPMTLFVRIQTRSGPHTIVASGITLAAASQISEAMELAGHHAEFVNQCVTTGTIPERVGRNEPGQRLKPLEYNRVRVSAAGL